MSAISFEEECVKNDSKAEVIGNNCLFGQIATFMETLHLTYTEVVDIIPYRNLLLMQKDKMRVVYGEIMEEVSDEEFMKMKNIQFSKNKK